MPAPLVVAALISAGSQLLTNKSKQPVPSFQPARFADSPPAPAFQPSPQQASPFSGAVMDAFLRKKLGLGTDVEPAGAANFAGAQVGGQIPAFDPNFMPIRQFR